MKTAILVLSVLLGPAQTESPAGWLSTEGKGAEWVRATAAARDLLGRLKTDDPLAAKYLSRIKARCALLRRAEGFDWKSLTAVDVLQGMLEDLSKGEVPFKRYGGQGVGFGYWSETMQRIEAIWVQVPPGYDPSRAYQIFMYYKCGGGIHLKDGKAHGGYRPTAEMCRKFDDTFHAWSSLSTQVKGRYGAEHELEEAMAALEGEFSIDPARVFLTGWSDGGFTSFWLASRFPHLVAGIAPNCANWQYGDVEEIGLFNVPVLVVDGWGDSGYNSINVTRFHALSNMGYDIQCLFGHHGHSYQPYEDEEEFGRILAWARTHRRNLHPKRVRYATWNLAWNRAYWFSIDRVIEPALASHVDAEVKEGNRIDVRAKNVAAYRLRLGGKLVDPSRPVEVETNGKLSYKGPFTPDLPIELAPRPVSKFVKTAEVPDELVAVLDRSSYDMKGSPNIPGHRWLAVRPTGGTESVQGWVPEDAKNDTDVTDRDLESCHLMLYGGPEINRVTAKIAGDLPVKFEKGRFTIGNRVYAEPQNGVKFLHPNPLNPKRYVIVQAFNDLPAARARGFHGIARGGWEFRAGDAVVYGLNGRGPRYTAGFGGAAHDFHVWNAAWGAPDPAVLGVAAERFEYAALLRLKADAMREAAGVDAAVFSSFPSSWTRWKTFLPEGPLTLNDLAVTHMFPEYALLCDVSGQTLRMLTQQGAASTVLFDKRDPGYVPGTSLCLSDLSPEKTYRIAIDYAGAWRHAFGFNVSKMPRLLPFKNAKEYLEAPGATLPLSNLRSSEIEWTEALAQYVRKRGKISPRPVSFDLTRYLADPETNDFSAYDWIHLRLGEGGPLLHLGLRTPGEPDLAAPRQGSKAFATMNRQLFGDWSPLGKKLPVQLRADLAELVVVRADGESAFKLVEGAKDPVGRLSRIRLRLANEGVNDLEGIAVLGDGAFHAIGGATWPAAKQTSYAAGLYDVSGDPKSPNSIAAKLFVFPKEAEALRPVVLPNVGYNLGLMGMERRFALKAKTTVSFPLVSIRLEKGKDGAVPALADVLEGVRSDLRADE